MIDEKEIKIGNWFHHNAEWCYRHDDGNIGEFDFQWESRDWYAEAECVLSMADVSCISITEEWLLKFGFNKDNYGIYEKVKNNAEYISGCKIELWTKFVNDSWQICIGEELDSLVEISKIKFVHQLQNLYHIIVGEELIGVTKTVND